MRTQCSTRLLATLALGLLASCATRSSLPAERTPALTANGPVVPAWSDASASAFDWATLEAIEAWLASADAVRWDHFRSEGRLKLGTGLMGIDPEAPEATRAARWERASEQFTQVLADAGASREQLDRSERLLAVASRGPAGTRAPRSAFGIAEVPLLDGAVPRARWARSAANPTRMDGIDRRYSEFTIHHSHTPAGTTAERIRRDHVSSRNYGDIGYHFVIGSDGTIWEGRALRYQGAHAGGDLNRGKLGICLVGQFESSRPTPRAIASLERLVRHLSEELDIPLGAVKGHGEVKATACPGRHLQSWVQRWRRTH